MIIHGMGDQQPDFARQFIETIGEQLGNDKDSIVIEPCWWADELQPKQDQLWRLIQEDSRMTWLKERYYMISHFSDPVQYLSAYLKYGQDTAYVKIHERIRESLEKIENQLTDKEQPPLMIIAHSLGCAIASNYIWDEQHKAGIGKTIFQKTETITSFITYGCNIPLFVPPVNALTCIQIPWNSKKEMSRWLNIFAPADILGFPMRNIWKDLQGTKIEDIAINPGAWPLSRTPWAHTLYEKDKEFQKIIVKEIRQYLKKDNV
jgi:hypothetical protein